MPLRSSSKQVDETYWSKPKMAQVPWSVWKYWVPLSFHWLPPPVPFSLRRMGCWGLAMPRPRWSMAPLMAPRTCHGEPFPNVAWVPEELRHVMEATQVLPYLGLADSSEYPPVTVGAAEALREKTTMPQTTRKTPR